MRIIFYLPVVTPWWMRSIVAPLIRCLAAAHEVHVLAPPPWRGTGVDANAIATFADLPGIRWHIVDDDDHPTMRTNAVHRAAIIDFVGSLEPDYVLCRAADFATVRGFPGQVRYLMEGGAAPLSVPPEWIVLAERPFAYGLLPALDAVEQATLDQLIAPEWERLTPLAQPDAATSRAFAEWAGLPRDRPFIAIPLEYEHPENFFPFHRVGATPNHWLIDELADAVDDEFFLAVTNHPLNDRHGDNRDVVAAVAAHGTRMRLLPGDNPFGHSTTTLLVRDAAGVIVGDSKIWSLAAFFGTPLLRRSVFETAAWVNACTDLGCFMSALRQQRPGADRDATRHWFAFHVANNLLDPTDPDLTAMDVLARIDRPIDASRWAEGFARFAACEGRT